MTLSYDPETGAHTALLATWSEDGEPRLSLELSPEQAVVRQTPVVIEW